MRNDVDIDVYCLQCKDLISVLATLLKDRDGNAILILYPGLALKLGENGDILHRCGGQIKLIHSFAVKAVRLAAALEISSSSQQAKRQGKPRWA